jgi:hypothetical protein
MHVSVVRGLFPLLLLFLAAVLIWGCIPVRDQYVEIDYYVMNTRSDEILVKNKDGAEGVVGFFLGSGEVYHFAYHADMAFEDLDPDPHGMRIVFDFYASGDDASFSEYIGGYEFHPALNDNYACVETCFVR